MTDEAPSCAAVDSIEQRASFLFKQHYYQVLRRTDRLFAGLMLVEWLGAIVAALVVSPRTWAGATGQVHVHIWTAFLLVGAVISLPVYLALRAPGQVITRHAIAVGQMLLSALLIHLTGGRIETHFHIFGSLAFLAFYRDWRVLVTATVVVAVDHMFRGLYWPQSVFGILTASPWRWVEHAAWVVFEAVFLGVSCVQGVREMKSLALQQAHLEDTNQTVEAEVERRTDELRATEARLRLIVEAAPCGMVMMRDDGVITMVNRKMEEMFGYPRQQMLGQPIEMLLPERFRDQHPAYRNAFFQNPQSRPMGENDALFGARQDGREIPVEIGLNPLKTEEGTYVLAAVVDTTERRKADRELKQYAELVAANNVALQQYAEEADAANRAKSEFLANMSHELRTPLNAIIGFSEGLLERTDRHPLNDHQKDRLTKIRKSGDHLLALINNVLDLAKVESGKVEVYVTEFEVEPLAQEIAALAEGLLKDRSQVQFQLELAPLQHPVKNDRDKIKQIVINLVGNAVKFTEQGQITLKLESNDRYLQIAVEDTGIGVPDDQLPKIFDKFHQAENAQHRSVKGTGLGLALCKSFAGLLGGTLTVRSVEGRGSTFTLSVPLTYDEARQQEQRDLFQQIKDRCRRATGSGKMLKVLCIEDDPASMEVLIDCLENEGHQIVPAFNGYEGLKLAREQRPDAITLDVMMPGLDGWEVLKQLKTDDETRNIPVIITTAIDDQRLALNLGADGFLLKPIESSHLFETVEQLSASCGCEVATLAIVDDDPCVRQILEEVLEEEGYRIQLYKSGSDFLASVSQQRPDAVVLDLMMPEIDGFGVLDALRSEPTTLDLPVIIMTAKLLSQADLTKLQGRIRAVIEKNGLSRDRALTQLVSQLKSLKQELVTT